MMPTLLVVIKNPETYKNLVRACKEWKVKNSIIYSDFPKKRKDQLDKLYRLQGWSTFYATDEAEKKLIKGTFMESSGRMSNTFERRVGFVEEVGDQGFADMVEMILLYLYKEKWLIELSFLDISTASKA